MADPTAGRLAGWGRPAAGIGVFLVVWEAAARARLVDPRFVPPPSTVGHGLGRILADPGFRAGAASTVLSWLIAITVATALGTAAGLLLGRVALLRTAGMLAVEFLRPLPGVALIPLVIDLIGPDAQTKISLAVFAGVWPVLFNTLYALGEVDPRLLEVARACRVGRARTLLWVIVPAVAPFVLTGVRLAASVALISLVSTEFLTGGTIGLGQFIYVSGSSAGRMDLVLAGTAFAGLLGLAANSALGTAGRRWLRWAPDAEPV